MKQVTSLKAQASNLTDALSELGIKLTKAQSLEVIAKQYGVDNWDTMSGLLKRKPSASRPPVLADMPGYPDSVWVEQGPYSVLCNVERYDEEALAYLHDSTSLQAFLDEYPENYEEGLDSVAIYLQGDGEDYKFTFRELLGLKYQKLGGQGTWCLADGDTFLRINCGKAWTPDEEIREKSPQLTIPETVKSAKGCRVLQLTSHDGSKHDIFAVVPPNLDIQTIKKKVDAEVARLKQLDRDNQDNPDYQEYVRTDLTKFIASLGCQPVDTDMCSENWDV